MAKNKILGDIRVLEHAEWLNGPLCGCILSQFGAEVIKVESTRGDMLRAAMLARPELESILSIINQNKKGITLNIKTEKGKEIFKELAKKSDVIIENMRGGEMERLGLGYEDIRKVNPGIIYASVSGFGHTGPYATRGAMDIIAQATSGIMAAMGIVDRAPAVPFADYLSGVYTALAVTLALRHRDKTGEGQWIDISMQDALFHLNLRAFGGLFSEELFIKLKEEFKGSKTLPGYGPFKAKDGYVVIVAFSDGEWNRLLECMGRKDLIGDKKYRDILTRLRHEPEIRKMIEDWAKDRMVSEVEDALVKFRVPVGPVVATSDVIKSPQLQARGMVQEVEHPRLGKIKVPGPVIKLSKTPGEVQTCAPGLGQHNLEVYSKLLGYTDEDLKKLKKEKVL